MFSANIIKAYRNVITICDSELLGKKFEEEKFQLDIKESFYKGEEMSEQELSKLIKDMKKEDATFNIVGEKSIAIALKLDIINEQEIKTIQGIPYSLVLL